MLRLFAAILAAVRYNNQRITKKLVHLQNGINK